MLGPSCSLSWVKPAYHFLNDHYYRPGHRKFNYGDIGDTVHAGGLDIAGPEMADLFAQLKMMDLENDGPFCRAVI